MNTALWEKASVTAESYRIPIQVTQIRKYRTTAYYICPRCNITRDKTGALSPSQQTLSVMQKCYGCQIADLFTEKPI